MTGTAAGYRAAGDLCLRAGGTAAGHIAGPSAKQEGGQRDISLSQSNWTAEGRAGHFRRRKAGRSTLCGGVKG